MSIAVPMLLGLLMVLFGAELFTNAVEWLGHKLGLGQGAVGSILAALGTALPETAVPVTAILLGNGTKEAHEVGVGGILGAPFLLVTLGSLVLAASLVFSRKKREMELDVPPRSFPRDMSYFLVAFLITVLVGCVRAPIVHHLAPFVLILLYARFIFVTLKDGRMRRMDRPTAPLYIDRKSSIPSKTLVLIQLVIALLLIVGGAKSLTLGVNQLARVLALPTFVVSALLIPIATELPETLNSVVWIRQNKDELALGNITGAMVFQSTLVPALGIFLTPWQFDNHAFLTGSLTLCAATFLFVSYRLKGTLAPVTLVLASFLYWLLPLQAFATKYGGTKFFWGLCGLLAVLFVRALWNRPHKQRVF